MAMEIRAAKLDTVHGYVRELPFHPVRKWRFDFAWPERRVALEVDGGQWVNGRHNRASSFETECVKASEAAVLGWRVLRANGAMVHDGRALDALERALAWMPPEQMEAADG